MTRFERQFRSVARTLGSLELMRSSMDEMLGLSEHDLLDKDAGRRFLDFYGDEGLRVGLERYGITAALERRGYDRLEIETRALDERHTLLLFGHAAGAPESERHRLVELVVRRDRLVPSDGTALGAGFDVLTVDWLLLQNPLARFTPERARLPGQDAPGLGIGERVLELLYRMAQRLQLQGLVAVAEYLHNAILYRRELPFFDPAHGGRLRALEELLIRHERLSIARASWAMEWGCVRSPDHAVVKWHGEAQVRAFDPALRAWMSGRPRVAAERRIAAATRLAFDRTLFDERWSLERDVLEGRDPVPA